MAVFSGTIYSEVLEMETGLTVALPYDRRTGVHEHGRQFAKPVKALYLLHGLSDNYTAWLHKSNVIRYAQKAGLAVIMPEVQRSFYFDMAMGPNYFTYVAHELPRLCEEMFGISQKREDTFIAGLSMGGYGAVKCALTRPDKYSACASFAGALDVRFLCQNPGAEWEKEWETPAKAILGAKRSLHPKDDNYSLARAVAKMPKGEQPRFLLTCGEQDFLLDINREYQAFMKECGMNMKYMEWPGDHDWDFFDESAKIAIDFFISDEVK